MSNEYESDSNMKTLFCEKYNFNKLKCQGYLASTGLGAAELPLASQIQQLVIAPNLKQLVTTFFAMLRLNDEADRLFSRGFRDDKLQQFLIEYLISLGVEFDQLNYFEQRLRMGIAHVNAGINLVVFQTGYRILQQLLIDAVPENIENAAILRGFILKITTIDLIIATAVYVKSEKTSSGALMNKNEASRGSVNQLLNNDQVNELLLTGLQSGSTDSTSCIAVAKIDELEKVESVYGKDTVDQVRKGITARLLMTLRPGDGVGIIAGGGYLFVLSQTTISIAEDICNRLKSSISQNPVSADNMTIPVTMSLVLSDVTPEAEHKLLIQRLEQQLTLSQSKSVNQLEIVNGVVGC